MKGHGKKKACSQGKVMENRMKRMGDQGSEKALFVLKT